MRTTRDTRLRALYAEEFKDHVLERLCGERSHRLWQLGRPGTSDYFAEVAILYGGKRLLVHGDVDEVLLWGYTPPEGCTEDLAIVKWAAQGQAEYIASKALFPKDDEWDHDVAIADLGCMHQEQSGATGWASLDAMTLRALSRELDADRLGHEWLMHAAAARGIDTEDVSHVGMCVHHSILMAQEVLKKLLALLAERRI